MAHHRPIDGHPTWVHDRGGPREPVLLLHGGLSNSDLLLDAIGPRLDSTHRVVAVVPGASHALPVEKPDVLAELVVEFLAATEPPRTLVPVRRASGGWVNRAG